MASVRRAVEAAPEQRRPPGGGSIGLRPSFWRAAWLGHRIPSLRAEIVLWRPESTDGCWNRRMWHVPRLRWAVATDAASPHLRLVALFLMAGHMIPRGTCGSGVETTRCGLTPAAATSLFLPPCWPWTRHMLVRLLLGSALGSLITVPQRVHGDRAVRHLRQAVQAGFSRWGQPERPWWSCCATSDAATRLVPSSSHRPLAYWLLVFLRLWSCASWRSVLSDRVVKAPRSVRGGISHLRSVYCRSSPLVDAHGCARCLASIFWWTCSESVAPGVRGGP